MRKAPEPERRASDALDISPSATARPAPGGEPQSPSVSSQPLLPAGQCDAPSSYIFASAFLSPQTRFTTSSKPLSGCKDLSRKCRWHRDLDRPGPGRVRARGAGARVCAALSLFRRRRQVTLAVAVLKLIGGGPQGDPLAHRTCFAAVGVRYFDSRSAPALPLRKPASLVAGRECTQTARPALRFA